MATAAASLNIDNFQDILDVLEQEPHLLQATRNYILSRELQAIPATVAELTAAVRELTANAQNSNARLDRLESAVARLETVVAQLAQTVQANTERLDRLEAIVAQLVIDQAELKETVAQLTQTVQANTERLDRLEAIVAQLVIDQAELKETVAQLARDQAELKETVAQLARDQAELKETVAQLVKTLEANTERLNRVSGQVDNITGDRYQRFVARIAHRRLRQRLHIPDMSIAHTDWAQGPLILDITTDSRLTDAEADDVSVIDFIAAGHDQNGNQAYAAGEISITAQPDDVLKTARRARLVAKALDAPAHPVVIGHIVPDDARAAALEHGVAIIAIAPPE